MSIKVPHAMAEDKRGLGKEISKCYNPIMTQIEQPPKVLHADPEHSGLRFIVVVILLLGLILGFVVTQLLLSLVASDTVLIEFATVLSCIGATILALTIAYVSELYLKRIWHSGTVLELDDSRLDFKKKKSLIDEEGNNYENMSFDWAKNVNLTRWFFKLDGYPRAGRERRVSGKWLCLACQIQQDESFLIIYSYFPEQEAELWAQHQGLAEPFHAISMAKLYDRTGQKKRGAATRPSIPSDMLTDKDGRYWLAERKRWRDGVELTRSDFTILMEYVEQRM